VFDGGGNRYTITFEGNVTREKALRLLDLIELLGGMPSVNPNFEETTSAHSKFDKLRSMLEKHFPIVWFSSKDAQLVYEQELKEPISLRRFLLICRGWPTAEFLQRVERLTAGVTGQ